MSGGRVDAPTSYSRRSPRPSDGDSLGDGLSAARSPDIGEPEKGAT